MKFCLQVPGSKMRVRALENDNRELRRKLAPATSKKLDTAEKILMNKRRTSLLETKNSSADQFTKHDLHTVQKNQQAMLKI